MRTSKATTIVLLSVLFSGHLLWALEGSRVTLEKKEGRTEAVVSAEVRKEQEAANGFLGRSFSMFENGIMGTASTTSRVVGKTTEVIVKGIGTASSFLFSPIFRTVDLKDRFEKKQE